MSFYLIWYTQANKFRFKKCYCCQFVNFILINYVLGMDLKLFIASILCYLQLATSGMNECRSSLLNGCVCQKTYYESHNEFIVNCTDRNFKNVSMLSELPEQTSILIFTGNHIESLPWNIFGELNKFSALRIIDMSNNGIREIKGKTYHHVPNVERLILNHNNLSISDDDMLHHPRIFSNFINLLELHLTNAFADFTGESLAEDLHDIFLNSNLTKLYKLHLEQNEIKNFGDKNVFCDLPSLKQLYLGDNLLPTINFNLTCLKKLEFLDLEQNNITKFSQNDLIKLDQLAYPHRTNMEPLIVDISGNPLRCDTAIKNLYNWMQMTNVTVRNKEHLECHQNKNERRYIVNLKNLAESKQAKLSQAIVVLLVLLVLILLALLSAYTYLSKDKIRKKLHPLIEAVSRKVQYTTIESQDV